MAEFEKITLDSKQNLSNNASSPSEEVNSNTKRINVSKKRLGFLAGFIVLVIAASFFTIVLPAQKTYRLGMKTQQQAKQAWAAIKNQDINLAKEELKKTQQSLSETQKSLQSFSFARFIPLFGGYYNDIDSLAKAGSHGLSAAQVLVESVEPYADVLGLKGQGSFVMGSAEDRIRVAVLTLGKITPRIDDVVSDLEQAREEIDKVNPNRYPGFLGMGKIQSQLKSLRITADEGVIFLAEARPLIKILPSLLGDPKERKYLVLFQNDNELRPTGGFITAYAVFRIDKGIIHVDRSDDIYNLDNTIRNKPKAPAPIAKYLPNVPVLHLRDSNLSPDFLESMSTFNSLYDKASAKVNVDGIIAIDTHVLLSTIKILDDEIVAGGVRFTTENDPRCNCPQVIYELERLISTPKSLDLRVTSLAAVQAQRKDMLGVLLYALMEKALKSSPKKYWGPLVQQMIQDAHEKHILFYLYDKAAQSGVEALNASGRIKSFEGDYLHVNEANFGGQKSNLFVEERVEQDYEVKSDGTIIKKVTINYKNPHPPSDCNLERGGTCLNAPLRNWVRVYVPKGSSLVSSKGSEVKITSYEEFDKTVYEGFLTVRPLSAVTYTLSYRLPFKLKKSSPLPVLIQKQPGTDKFEYTIKVNGKQKEKFPLTVDKLLKLEL